MNRIQEKDKEKQHQFDSRKTTRYTANTCRKRTLKIQESIADGLKTNKELSRMGTNTRTSLSNIATPNVLRQLTASIVTGVPTDLPADLAKYWLSNTDVLHRRLRVLLHDDTGDSIASAPHTIDKRSIAIYYRNTVEKLLERVDIISDVSVSSRHFTEIYSANKINVDIYLVKFLNTGDVFSKNGVLWHLKRNGLRPATLKELLSFGIYLKEKTKDFGHFLTGSFVAAGSEWISPCGRVTPVLHWRSDLKLIRSSFWNVIDPDSNFLGLRI